MELYQKNSPNKEYIKYVANYLRKSRGDLEKDLEKHRKVLSELCIENNWKYVEYEEIVSGENIELRPVVQKLLKDVENGVYDAVCVMDIDRLGRGDMGDQDKIKKVFMKTNTLVITPQQIYNLSNDDDEFIVDMKGFIARREYKQIVKRLVQGKKVGARMGMWTNGSPPYPYEYERWKDKYNEKGIVVNDTKLLTYRFMIDSTLKDKKSPNEIAWELNSQQISAPRGTRWHGNTIYRILVDETHLGHVISNKTQGDGHKIKKTNSKKFVYLPKNEWNIVKNCHEAIKTQEEHDEILIFLNRKCKSPKRGISKISPLSHLIKCKLCGHTMVTQRRTNRKDKETIKPCWYKDEYGNQCKNRGSTSDILYVEIKKELDIYEQKIINRIKNPEHTIPKKTKDEIDKKIKEINIKEKSLQKIFDAYEADIYDIETFRERKTKVQEEITIIENDLKILQLELAHSQRITDQERLLCLQKFKQEINKENQTYQRQNELYKSIIKDIIWERKGSEINIEVNFL